MFSSYYLSGNNKCIVNREIISFNDYLSDVNKGEFLPIVERSLFFKVKFNNKIRGGEGITWLQLCEISGFIFFSSNVIRIYDDVSLNRMSNFSKLYFKRLFDINMQYVMIFISLKNRNYFFKLISTSVKIIIYKILSIFYFK